MYLLEYFKTDGKTITLQYDDMEQLERNIQFIIARMGEGKIISFNVEVIYGNVRKD